MTTTKPITKATVQKELRRIIAENPDSVNPYTVNAYGMNTCVYHQGRGRNIRRCIIGQLGWNLGLPTPAPEGGDAADLVYPGGIWEGRFTEAAAQYMDKVQYEADGGTVGDPKPWGQVSL